VLVPLMTGTFPCGPSFPRLGPSPWAIPTSTFACQLPLSPMVVFAIGIEHALDVTVQGPHDPDAREHSWAAGLSRGNLKSLG
jgi:hypothetical protein